MDEQPIYDDRYTKVCPFIQKKRISSACVMWKKNVQKVYNNFSKNVKP